MKIIQINNVYSNGSTGKIVADLHSLYLSSGIDSIVLYGRGQRSKDKRATKVCSELYSHINKFFSMISGVMYGGCFLSTNKIIRIIKKEKPDIVHLHCINGYFLNIYRLINWLKKNRIKTVLTLHAEFIHTANCGYSFECEKWKTGCGKCPRLKQVTNSFFIDRTHGSWIKMKKAFSGFDTLIIASVSSWLMNRAKQSPILLEHKHCVVTNGLDEDIFHYYDSKELGETYRKQYKHIIFHATPGFTDDSNHIKGGYYLIELAKKMKDSCFLVAGPFKQDINIPSNVVLLGKISNQLELAKYYSLSDLTLLVSKKETFSMILAESMSCGTPVVGFEAGGPESITISDYSVFVEHGNVDKLYEAAVTLLNKKIDKKTISLRAIEKYSKKAMFKSYLSIYNEIIKQN